MQKKIVVHYSEIALKGKNRNYFEDALVRNIKAASGRRLVSVRKTFGRIVCVPAPDADDDDLMGFLEKVPGIAHVSTGLACGADMEQIRQAALCLLSKRDFHTFGVAAKRADKSFALTSTGINQSVGEHIVNRMQKKVDLSRPDVWLYIEVTAGAAFIFCAKRKGPGGLPVGVSGKVACSLSGGIDSPVAAYLMMKRGCRVIFVHARNENEEDFVASGKIERIVKALNAFQVRSKLYMVPFGVIQRTIISLVPSKFRMIVYRRFMLRFINLIADNEDAGAVVTGDSLGQVASQTLENIVCIRAASHLPVLSPLIGMNKEEIVGIAKAIGTYEASIMPYMDCCSFMIARHPETRADCSVIERYESAIESADSLVRQCVDNALVLHLEPQAV